MRKEFLDSNCFKNGKSVRLLGSSMSCLIITSVQGMQVGGYVENCGIDLHRLPKERGLEGVIARPAFISPVGKWTEDEQMRQATFLGLREDKIPKVEDRTANIAIDDLARCLGLCTLTVESVFWYQLNSGICLHRSRCLRRARKRSP